MVLRWVKLDVHFLCFKSIKPYADGDTLNRIAVPDYMIAVKSCSE